jgi:glycosyltransferase involved in cell wall biosynthesis
MKISVIVPVFNEAEVILKFYEKLNLSMKRDFSSSEKEIIFVNDGSSDSTQKILLRLKESGKEIKIIQFTKNFGQHNAIFAGLNRSSGDYIVIIDADLQDRPEELINLYRKIRKGYNIVYSVRRDYDSSNFRRYSSFIFWKMLKIASGLSIPENQSMLKIFDRNILENILGQEEINPFLPIIFARAGLKQTSQYVKNDARIAGKSKYTSRKMFSLAANAIFYYSFLRVMTLFLIGYVILNILLVLFINTFGKKLNVVNLIFFFEILSICLFLFLTIRYMSRTAKRYQSKSIYKIKSIK